MNLVLFITGLLQIILSVIIGILFVYYASKIFQNLTRGINDIEELKNNNVAVAILNGSIILSLIIVVMSSIETSITIFSNTIRNPDTNIIVYLKMALLMLGHIIAAGVIAFAAIYIALKFFMWLTKDLDELSEIKQNNIAVSIYLGIIIVAFALLLEPGVRTILDALIPFPPVTLKEIGLL